MVDNMAFDEMNQKENSQEKPQQSNLRKHTPREQKSVPGKSAILYLHDLFYLVAAVIVVLLLCFRIVIVSGTSMNPTLLDGDYLLLLGNVFYHNPQQGDIIVASKDTFKDGEPIVKRVIATEGQVVDIKKGTVFVDGNPLEEVYTLTSTSAIDDGLHFPLTVDKGCLFVLGDNRNGSCDSRYTVIGLIDKRQVLGKVFFLCLPGTNYGKETADLDRIGVVS